MEGTRHLPDLKQKATPYRSELDLQKGPPELSKNVEEDGNFFSQQVSGICLMQTEKKTQLLRHVQS